jgi:hypothetical protein
MKLTGQAEYRDLFSFIKPVRLLIGLLRGLTIKFANSPPCACRRSSGQKPQYSLTTLAYQVYYLEVLKRLRENVRRKRPELFANNS